MLDNLSYIQISSYEQNLISFRIKNNSLQVLGKVCSSFIEYYSNSSDFINNYYTNGCLCCLCLNLNCNDLRTTARIRFTTWLTLMDNVLIGKTDSRLNCTCNNIGRVLTVNMDFSKQLLCVTLGCKQSSIRNSGINFKKRISEANFDYRMRMFSI